MKKATIFGLLGIFCLLGGCKKDSQSQPAASGNTPTAVQAATPAPAPAPAPMPEIRGIVTQKDGTEFVAEAVLNECGTNADPTDCLLKTVHIESDPYLICPQCQPIVSRELTALQHQIEPTNTDVVYMNDYGKTKNTVDVTQITLQLEDRSYLALGCAIGNLQPVEKQDTDLKEAVEIEYFSGYDAANPREMLCDDGSSEFLQSLKSTFDFAGGLKSGQKYRFGRRDNTVVFHEIAPNGKDYSWYFLVFGTCATVHECQELPRAFHLKDKNWQELVAPWAWESYRKVMGKDEALKAEYEARLEAKKKYSDTPR
jgi:hypothetical protein